MSTTLAALCILASSLATSLVLTPLLARAARRYKILDRPSARRVHASPVPRLGGPALYGAFFLPLAVMALFPGQPASGVFTDSGFIWLCAGATLVFFTGLTDDITPLPPWVKLSGHVAAAGLAWAGGIRIHVISLTQSTGLELGLLGLPATLFWFVLIINAINLIDGLDGLAAGVTMFVSLILLVICINAGKPGLAMGFAALAGSSMGFLRYNFNPASIFMGDSGSYFLGYMLAALSAWGSVKGQTTLALLIPFIALGVPLFDTLWAALRRFVRGRKLFSPDQGHLHHRLLKLGLTQRRAVLVLYGATVLLGIIAYLLVHARDAQAATILLVPGVLLVVAVRKLGYLEYLAMDKVYGWFRDIIDVAGINRERRSFLDIQLHIEDAADRDEMWEHACEALRHLGFDHARLMNLRGGDPASRPGRSFIFRSRARSLPRRDPRRELFLKLPLVEENGAFHGTLILRKDLAHARFHHYTLRRVEHLRKTLIRYLRKEAERGPGKTA